MDFPKGATKRERQINWFKIAEISDHDFGFNTPKEKTNIIRFCARIILVDSQNNICIIKSEKHGYMQLPGGGIEKEESITQALSREAEEETGYLITNIDPLGYVVEKRGDIQNTHDWDQEISFVFKASPAKKVSTKYTPIEIAEGFTPIWMNLDEFIAKQTQKEGRFEGYSGMFSDRRSLLIAKYYRTKLNNQILEPPMKK